MSFVNKYLPYQKHRFHSSLAIEELITRLDLIVENDPIKRKRNFFGKVKTNKEYEGAVFINGFRINGIIDTKNSFLPDIYGSFEETNGETEVTIILKLQLPVMLLSGLIMSMLVVLCFVIIPILIFETGFEAHMIIYYLILAGTYAFMILPFKTQCYDSLKLLKSIFKIENE